MIVTVVQKCPNKGWELGIGASPVAILKITEVMLSSASFHGHSHPEVQWDSR